MAIKAIIFDAGGVLLSGSGTRFLQTVEKELGLKAVKNPEEQNGAVFGRKMQIGQISPEEELDGVFGGNLEKKVLDRVVKIFEEEWPQDPEMVALAKKLGERYRVALLSNTEATHVSLWRKNGFVGIFDEVVVSNEVHLVKPDEKIYLLMLEKLGLQAEECVFIDDILENVEAAEKIGIHGIHFTGKQKMLQEFGKLGVVV